MRRRLLSQDPPVMGDRQQVTMLCYFMHFNTLCNKFLLNEVILRLFNSDTEEDDLVLVRRRKMKTEIHDFPGRLVIFLTSRVTGTVRKKTFI